MNGIGEGEFKMTNNIEEYGLTHDSSIVSYIVDFEKQILQLNTNHHDEKVIIKFQGLLTHDFKNVVMDNIIFGISQVTIESFILEKGNTLSDSLKYGFPTIEVCNIKYFISQHLWECVDMLLQKRLILL